MPCKSTAAAKVKRCYSILLLSHVLIWAQLKVIAIVVAYLVQVVVPERPVNLATRNTMGILI